MNTDLYAAFSHHASRNFEQVFGVAREMYRFLKRLEQDEELSKYQKMRVRKWGKRLGELEFKE